MPYALGIDLGSGHLTAALCRNDRERWAEPEVLALDEAPVTESVLHLTDEGTVEVGSRALRHVTTRPDRVTRDFVSRVGDEVPISLAGQPYPAEVLIAAVVGWIADYAEASEGLPASQLVVTHPAGWGSHRRATLLGALREVSLPELTLLPRPVAAAESYAATERVEVGQEIAVHSLGANRFESAVLRRGSFGFELRAHADSVEAMGGDLFDDLLAARVLDELGTEVEPVALAKLRAACRTAKERLSTELAVTVPAPARSTRGTVMVNRTDLEELIRPAVEVTVASLQRTIQAAGTTTGALRAVVLVGGSGRIPLVSELVSAGVRVRVAVAADPELSVARGAALAAARVAKPTVQAPAVNNLPALAHKPEPIARAAVTHTDLMRFDDLPPEDLADIGPPPPRPPVDIVPLEPPKRRLLRLGSRSGNSDGPDDLDGEEDFRPARRVPARRREEPDLLPDDDLDLLPDDDRDPDRPDVDLDPDPAPRRRSGTPPHQRRTSPEDDPVRARRRADPDVFDLDAGPRSSEFDPAAGPRSTEYDLDARPRRRADSSETDLESPPSRTDFDPRAGQPNRDPSEYDPNARPTRRRADSSEFDLESPPRPTEFDVRAGEPDPDTGPGPGESDPAAGRRSSEYDLDARPRGRADSGESDLDIRRPHRRTDHADHEHDAWPGRRHSDQAPGAAPARWRSDSDLDALSARRRRADGEPDHQAGTESEPRRRGGGRDHWPEEDHVPPHPRSAAGTRPAHRPENYDARQSHTARSSHHHDIRPPHGDPTHHDHDAWPSQPDDPRPTHHNTRPAAARSTRDGHDLWPPDADDGRSGRHNREPWPGHAEDDPRAGHHAAGTRARADHSVTRQRDSGPIQRADDPWTGHDPSGRHGTAEPGHHTSNTRTPHDIPDTPISRHGAEAGHHTGNPRPPYDAPSVPANRHGLDAESGQHTGGSRTPHDPGDPPSGRHERDAWPPRGRRRRTDDSAFNESVSRARHASADHDADHDADYQGGPRRGRDFR